MLHCTENYVNRLIARGAVGNIAVRVGRGDEILADITASSDGRARPTGRTLFDMASVTKIFVTTSLALIAIDRGLLSCDDPVGKFFPTPEDKRELTVFHLLTHTMGIGHKSMLGSGLGYSDIQRYVLELPLDIPIGTDVLYSCPGFILLGRILEERLGGRLDELFYELVARPLGMTSSLFLPGSERGDIVNSNIAPEERGLVNDYNCRYLGGVCGNAGLFSCIDDTTAYVKMLLSRGEPLVTRGTFEAAARNYTDGMSESRGLGYLYVDERYSQTGGLFPRGSIGHCGHTGQSVFVDVESGLYVIVLSDATVCSERRNGREIYSEVKQMRGELHAAIKADLACHLSGLLD